MLPFCSPFLFALFFIIIFSLHSTVSDVFVEASKPAPPSPATDCSLRRIEGEGDRRGKRGVKANRRARRTHTKKRSDLPGSKQQKRPPFVFKVVVRSIPTTPLPLPYLILVSPFSLTTTTKRKAVAIACFFFIYRSGRSKQQQKKRTHRLARN